MCVVSVEWTSENCALDEECGHEVATEVFW